MNRNPTLINSLRIPAPPNPAAEISLVLASVLGVLAGVAGLVGFLGWVLGIERLTDWDASGTAIQPNTTVCFMLGGAAVVLLAARQRKFAVWFGVASGAIGAATLSEHLLGIDLGIDALLTFGRTFGQTNTVTLGRMGPPAAFSWTLLGCAFLLLTTDRGRRWGPGVALVVIFLASISFVGYLFGADTLYALPHLTAIAWQASAMFIVLAVGLLAAQPDLKPSCLFLNTGVIGLLLRRLVLPIVALPLVINVFRVAGQDAGLYDVAMGRAMFCVVLIAMMLAGLILIGNEALNFERSSVEGARSTKRVESLSRMMTAQEEERRRIAAEIHDGLGQHMTALRLQLQALRTMAGDNGIKPHIESLAKTAEDIDIGLTEIVRAFRPRSLDMLGLSDAIAHHVTAWEKTTGIAAEFHSNGYRRGMLTDEAETALYRILQEALNNCGKHSGAKSVNALLTARSDTITLAIEDDGCGFLAHDSSDGLGLTSMRERAELAGGQLDIESGPDGGTTILVSVPVQDSGSRIHESV